MKISVQKLELALARSGRPRGAFRKTLSAGTYARIRHGADVRPATLGKIARALGVDPAELIEEV